MVKKMKKQVKQVGEIALIGGAATIGIGALGGNTGAMTGATSMLPAMGTVIGAGGLIRMTEKSFKTKKMRKRRK